jgi:ribosomal protein S12 methylthiotransferase accessory factor YcaO
MPSRVRIRIRSASNLGTAAAVAAVGRIIERWIEKRRQRENIELTIEAYKLDPEAARIVADLALAHAEVSISYPLNSATPTAEGTDLGEGAQ